MQIYFGETVRQLRREKGLTQEQLAARLNVSFQTISKWERGESLPDLTMLPVLAVFFGVTTDDLLGVNQAENERRVREVIAAYDSRRPDCAEEYLPVLKTAAAEYPLDYRLWVRYMECLLICARGLEGGLAVEDETREIYENIVAHCTDDSVRMRAKRLFVMHLHSLGQAAPERQAEAEQFLAEMPDLRTCREHIAIMVAMPGEGQRRACEHAIAELEWMLEHARYHLALLESNTPADDF